jgi:hypothetical protein
LANLRSREHLGDQSLSRVVVSIGLRRIDVEAAGDQAGVGADLER